MTTHLNGYHSQLNGSQNVASTINGFNPPDRLSRSRTNSTIAAYETDEEVLPRVKSPVKKPEHGVLENRQHPTITQTTPAKRNRPDSVYKETIKDLKPGRRKSSSSSPHISPATSAKSDSRNRRINDHLSERARSTTAITGSRQPKGASQSPKATSTRQHGTASPLSLRPTENGVSDTHHRSASDHLTSDYETRRRPGIASPSVGRRTDQQTSQNLEQPVNLAGTPRKSPHEERASSSSRPSTLQNGHSWSRQQTTSTRTTPSRPHGFDANVNGRHDDRQSPLRDLSRVTQGTPKQIPYLNGRQESSPTAGSNTAVNGSHPAEPRHLAATTSSRPARPARDQHFIAAVKKPTPSMNDKHTGTPLGLHDNDTLMTDRKSSTSSLPNTIAPDAFLERLSRYKSLSGYRSFYARHSQRIYSQAQPLPDKEYFGRLVRIAWEKIHAECKDEQKYLAHLNVRKSRISRIADAHRPCMHTTLQRASPTWSRNGLACIKRKAPFASMPPIQESAGGLVQVEKGNYSVELLDANGKKVIRAKRPFMDVPVISWAPPKSQVPTYTHCAAVSRNVAAYNQRTLHVYPYFGEEVSDEVYEEFQQRYDQDIDLWPKKLLQSQKARWHIPTVRDFLRSFGCNEGHVLWYLLSPTNPLPTSPDSEREKSCKDDFDRTADRWMLVFSNLQRPSDEAIRLAKWACTTFLTATGMSLWHVVRKSPFAALTDDQDPHNVKGKPVIDQIQQLACRICHEHDCPYHKVFVENADGSSRDMSDSSDDSESVASIEALDIDWPPNWNHERRVALPLKLSNHGQLEDEIVYGPPRTRDRAAYNKLLLSATGDVQNRRQFYPCDHDGPCNGPHCRCWRDGLLCEKSCGCSSTCDRRFLGCSCHALNKRSVCYRDDRCECYRLRRECDPDLCKGCKADVVLDPVNRYDDSLKRHACQNVQIQLAIPKRTILGRSRIHGFGVYAGEHIKKHDFVGEYKGEVLCEGERVRRGAAGEVLNMSYMFQMTKGEVPLSEPEIAKFC